MNYSLYLITDPHLAKNSLFSIVSQAISGGVTMVQYRNKNASTKVLTEEASRLQKLTAEAGTPLIINDRVDVALAVDADGVHLGQSDMPIAIARKLLGTKKIIGVSVKTVEQAKQAVKGGANYLGVGPIFKTQTKTDAGESLGTLIIEKIVQEIDIPVVGIGGITKENASEMIRAGAKGIAVVSAIMGKQNPEREAKELLQEVQKSLY